MSPKYFVEITRKVVHEQAVNDVIETLLEPVGNKTSQENVQMSAFYGSLTEEQKGVFNRILLNTSEMTMYGLFCVLDGVRAVENGENKGSLELWYRNGEFTQLLNDPDDEFLHDLFI